MNLPAIPRITEDGTVFIVDDDDAVRRSVVALVRATGLVADGFSSGEEFLESRKYAEPGCVVSDVRMLGMNGLELLSQIRARRSRIPVIVVTAYADVRIAVEAMKGGAQTVLEKPYREQDLWDHVVLALRTDRQQREKQSQANDLRQRLDTLTEKEQMVLKHLVQGVPNKVISRELDIAPRTVDLRRQVLLKKMGAVSTLNLVRDLAAVGLIDEID